MQKLNKKILIPAIVGIVVVVAVVVGLIIGLSGNSGDGPQGNDPQELKITIAGLQESYTFNTGDEFNQDILLEGVTVTDQNGKSYIENVEVKGLQAIPLNEDGTLKQAGDHTLRLNVVIDGKTVSTKMITVKVIFQMVETSDIIYNGDFETGTVDPFIVTEVDGGVAAIEVVEGQLVFSIESLSWQAAFPRLDYGKVDEPGRFTLEDGKYYEVSFDAKASVARHVHVQVGQLFAAAPWFADALSVQQYILLSTEMETYSFRFQADASRADLTALSLLFGHGTLPDGYISEKCDIIYDNIKIVEVDNLGADTMAPTITSTGITKYYVGDVFDAASCVVVSDDQDKNPVLEVVEAESTLPAVDGEGKLTTAGEYTIVYIAKDVAGNESAKFTLNITVAQPASAGSELIKNNDFADTTPTADGITDWIIFADSGNTLAGNAANGVMTLTVNNAASAANWNPQFKQAGLEIKEGNSYKLTVTLESTAARKVQVAIQNDQWWNMHLEQYVELAANTPVTVEYEFTAVAPSPNVIFFLGLGAIDGQTVAEVHNVKVSGLSLVQTGGTVDPTPTPDPDKVEIPAEGMLSDDLNDWYQSVDKAEVINGKLVLTVNAETVANNYDKQLKMENLTLDISKAYEVSIVVKSSIARKIQIMVQNNNSWEELNTRIEELPAGQEVEITYTFTPAANPGSVLFGLMLGKVGGENPVGEHTIEISKISLSESETEAEIVEIPAEGLLSNNLAKWISWAEGSQSIKAEAVNENVVLTVNSTDAGVNYSPQFKLEGLSVEAGKTYVVEIKLTSSIARSIQVMAQENVSWAVLVTSIETLEAGVEKTITLEFTASASYSNNVLFGLMLGKLDGVATPSGEHTITISKLSLTEK